MIAYDDYIFIKNKLDELKENIELKRNIYEIYERANVFIYYVYGIFTDEITNKYRKVNITSDELKKWEEIDDLIDFYDFAIKNNDDLEGSIEILNRYIKRIEDKIKKKYPNLYK